MTALQPTRIFISYATSDGATFAGELRRDLETRSYVIWQDIAALEGGRDWWTQIESALKSQALDHLVLVLTPAALGRPVIRDEIHLARQQGKTIIPVRGPGFDDYAKLPRHIGQVLDLAKPEHHVTFLSMLAGPSQQKPVPMMISAPPADYVARPAEIDALKALLLATETKEAVAITAALRGTTGYGKTTLARALAYDPDIRDAYFDGTLFVELGQQGRGRIVAVIADIIGLIDPARPRQFHTIDGAKTALGEALGNRKFLFVIDDVWNRGDLVPFLHGGPGTTRLITTRFAGELPTDVLQERVAAMTGGADGEAWQMLAAGLPADQVAANKPALVALAERRHNWPQALRLANGFLRTRMGLSKHDARGRSGPRPALGSLADAIKAANAGLDARGGAALDPNRLKLTGDDAERYEQRHTSVAEGMALNLSLLDETNRARFAELGVFPEDVDVPIGMAARLWAETGGLDRHDTESLLAACDDASLLLDLDFARDTFRFHDSVREYLHVQAGKTGVVTQHRRLIRAMGDIGGEGEVASSDLDYFYRYLLDHLAGAEDRATLDQLLLDPGWLKAKLAGTSSPLALVSDYNRFGQGPAQNLIGRTLRIISGICTRDQRQLLPQLHARMLTDPAAAPFALAASKQVSSPALLCETSSLAPAGAEQARFDAPAGVNKLALLLDGRIAIATGQNLTLLDLQSGIQTDFVAQFSSTISAMETLPDGRLLLGVGREAMLLDISNPAEIGCVVRHETTVNAVAILPDDRIVSVLADGTVHRWEIAAPSHISLLKGRAHHNSPLISLPSGGLAAGCVGEILLLNADADSEPTLLQLPDKRFVSAFAVLPNGRLVSGALQDGIRVWDIQSQTEVSRIGGSDWIDSLAVLTDGRLASASGHSIKLWNLDTGVETIRLEGHTAKITSLISLPDGRLVSGSADKTVRLWEVMTVAETARSERQTGEVGAISIVANGCIASGAFDIRFWDTSRYTEIARITKNTGAVCSMAMLPNGLLATGSRDQKGIRIWDLATYSEVGRLRGHDSWVNGLTTLQDGRLASGAHDIRLWDMSSMRELKRYAGDAEEVFDALSTMPDGRLVAAGKSRVLVLDTRSEAKVKIIECKAGPVVALAVFNNGWIAMGSYGGFVQVWDCDRDSEVITLRGHTGVVHALSVLANGFLASGASDNTVRIWDVGLGQELCRLELDAPVRSLLALSDRRLVVGDSFGRLHWLKMA